MLHQGLQARRHSQRRNHPDQRQSVFSIHHHQVLNASLLTALLLISPVNTYISSPREGPTTTACADNAILYISDIMGIYPNSQLLADSFAATTGYLTIMPDLFRGDPWTPNSDPSKLMDWIKNHPTEVVDPIVQTAITYLREMRGVKKIAAVGYCFGGKVINQFQLALIDLTLKLLSKWI